MERRETQKRVDGTCAEGGPGAALRQAQRALFSNPRTAHPFYWAPFILVGAR